MEPAIERILTRVLGAAAGGAALSGATVTPLPGGITNRNYRVDAGGAVYVVRIGGENTALLGIDREREHACSAIAARLGVGAEVLGFLPDERALVTRFIAGQPVTGEDAARPGTLRRIVAAIRRYHQGPPFPGSFSPFAAVRDYAALAARHGVTFPPESAPAREVLDQIESALGKLAKPVPCHNDLLAANFLDDGAAIRILDWEYAAMGDPFFDLGNLAANLELKPEACGELLRLYSGGARPRALARRHRRRLASGKREGYWGLLQLGIARLEFDYAKYARDHLQRFLRNAAAPEVPRWLEEAAS
jgi:thiamine kinase-like enzyme